MLLAGCGAETPAAPQPEPVAPALLVATTADWGLDFTHDPGVSQQRYMPEIMGSGVALFDMDNDGDLDVYFVQGGAVDGHVQRSDRLYRNDLDANGPRFIDVTGGLGNATVAYGMGVSTGDVDGDGWIDLYITNFGDNYLLSNQGDGTFVDIAEDAGVNDDRWSVPATFADLDNDGDHDLYVGNYVDFTVASHKDCTSASGLADYCSPHTYSAVADRVFLNVGDGNFTDVSGESGIRSIRSKALGVSASDFNGDGWTDLYVANDGTANQLWINQGDGTFDDTALMSGSALNFEGSPEASMGVDAADVDADGDEDLFITHLRGETNTLYVNRGNAVFEDRTIRLGLAGPSIPLTGFGTAWVDLNNDGHLDLFAANGAVTIEESRIQAGDDYPFDQRNQVFLNTGTDDLAFEEWVDEGGALSDEAVSRGAAFGDIDNDGDIDVVVANNNGPAQVLQNTTSETTGHQWLGLDLRQGGVIALGAKASLIIGDVEQSRRVRTSGSYASANDPRIVFGLGDSELATADVRVVWTDGTTETFPALPLNAYYTLEQGSGTAP